jgi:hypothetical protein
MLLTSEEGSIGKAIAVMANVAALLHSLPRLFARRGQQDIPKDDGVV